MLPLGEVHDIIEYFRLGSDIIFQIWSIEGLGEGSMISKLQLVDDIFSSSFISSCS